MRSLILEPHTEAGRWASSQPEVAPAAWPGIYVPNFSEWQYGDIVLVRKADGAQGLALQVSQAVSLNAASRAGSIWTHAALYVGDDQVIEAVPGQGVVQRSVWTYCQHRQLRVRRVAQPFSRQDRWLIAQEARLHAGKDYSLAELVRSKLWPATTPDPDAYYCSTFVGFVIFIGTGRQLYSRPEHRPLHPAVLASHPDLDDVDLEWRVLASGDRMRLDVQDDTA